MAELTACTIELPICEKRLPALLHACCTELQAEEKKPAIFDGILVNALATLLAMLLNHDFAEFHALCTELQAWEKKPDILLGMEVKALATLLTMPLNHDTTELQADWIALQA